MFCSKCGTELVEGAAFCASCGQPVGQPVVNQTTVEQPVEQPIAPAPSANINNDIFALPNIAGWIKIGISVLMFIFMFCPWFKFSFWGLSETFTIFTKNLFDLSFFIGLAKVFAIINIFVFVIYAALRFIDIKKIIPALPQNIDFKQYSEYAFGGVYALQWVLTLIGIIATEYVGITVCLILAFVFTAAFAVTVFKADIVDGIVSNVTEKK
ncbi:MAG: zinc-ribbon domain-containing protein [Clostridia bacterium]|nr:zinc-ribbon domain-containing protein [Clostridia bacterium]